GAGAEDRRQLAAFRGWIGRWSAWRDRDGNSAFAIPTRRSTADPQVTALDQISFAAWLDARGLTSERLRWLCDYACRDDYALVAADTSAWAGLLYFASRQRTPGAAAQSVFTRHAGNHALVAHLATHATIETGVAVHSVDEAGQVVATGKAGMFGVRAERVIVAVPAFVRSRIVSPGATGGSIAGQGPRDALAREP